MGSAGLPAWIKWSLYLTGTFLIFPVLEILHARYYYYFGYIILFVVVIVTMFRPSRVSLVRFRERSHIIAENRKGWVKTIVLIVLGGVIGKIVEHFASRWWPK